MEFGGGSCGRAAELGRVQLPSAMGRGCVLRVGPGVAALRPCLAARDRCRGDREVSSGRTPMLLCNLSSISVWPPALTRDYSASHVVVYRVRRRTPLRGLAVASPLMGSQAEVIRPAAGKRGTGLERHLWNDFTLEFAVDLLQVLKVDNCTLGKKCFTLEWLIDVKRYCFELKPRCQNHVCKTSQRWCCLQPGSQTTRNDKNQLFTYYFFYPLL